MADPELSHRPGTPFDAKILGQRLRSVREVGGFDQMQWSQMIGKVSQTVSNWELGRSSPTYDDLLKYHSLLGCDLHWLLTGQSFNPDEIIQTVVRMMKKDSALQEH